MFLKDSLELRAIWEVPGEATHCLSPGDSKHLPLGSLGELSGSPSVPVLCRSPSRLSAPSCFASDPPWVRKVTSLEQCLGLQGEDRKGLETKHDSLCGECLVCGGR